MFNLIDEPWISVLYRNGRPGNVSISQALVNADSLQLAYSNPMDRFAVFRFILALSYWCFANTGCNPKEKEALPNLWNKWLIDNKAFFELLGETRRFMQAEHDKRTRPISDLIHELPTASNLWHFNHVTDYVDGLCPACCVMGLLRLPAFTTIGGRGISAGINDTPPIYAIWHGSSLADMVLRNWHPRENMGIPAWIDPENPEQDGEVGLLAGLTWLPRRVKLHDPIPGDKHCSACGAKSKYLVYSCYLDNIRTPRDTHWDDPHTISKDNGDLMRSNISLMSSDKHTFIERDWYKPLSQYFAKNIRREKGILFLLGFTTQQNKYIDVWEMNTEVDPGQVSSECLEQMAAWPSTIFYVRKRSFTIGKTHFKLEPMIVNLVPHVEKQTTACADDLANSTDYGWVDVVNNYKSNLKSLEGSLVPHISVKARIAMNKIQEFKLLPVTKRKTQEKES